MAMNSAYLRVLTMVGHVLMSGLLTAKGHPQVVQSDDY